MTPRKLLTISMAWLALVMVAKTARGEPGGPAALGPLYISEIKLGVLAHDMPGLWSFYRYERGLDLNGEVAFGHGLRVLGGAIRPVLGGSWSTSGQTSRAYADLRWQWESPSNIFFGIGLGIAVHNGVLGPTDIHRKALGARELFHIPIELGYRFDGHNSISIYFEHMSNGYTASSNEGLDALGIRYGYKF